MPPIAGPAKRFRTAGRQPPGGTGSAVSLRGLPAAASRRFDRGTSPRGHPPERASAEVGNPCYGRPRADHVTCFTPRRRFAAGMATRRCLGEPSGALSGRVSKSGGARRGRREARDLPPRSVVPARGRHHDRRPVRRARPDRCRRGRADRGGAAGHFRRLERAREPSGARARDRGHPARRPGRHARPQLRRLARAGARRGQARRDRRGAELAARRARARPLHPPGRAARHAGRRGLRRDARRPGCGDPAHDHARRRL